VITDQAGALRLLPWSSPEGKPCYLSSSDGTGYVSRLADEVEDAQLTMSAELLGHAADMLADRKVTPPQLHFLASRMAEALRDVHRVAESRGARLPEPACDDVGEEDADEGGGDESVGVGSPASRG
jgi:hypothetical protein